MKLQKGKMFGFFFSTMFTYVVTCTTGGLTLLSVSLDGASSSFQAPNCSEIEAILSALSWWGLVMGNEILEKQTVVKWGFGVGLLSVQRLCVCLMLELAWVIYLWSSVPRRVAFIKDRTSSFIGCRCDVRPPKSHLTNPTPAFSRRRKFGAWMWVNNSVHKPCSCFLFCSLLFVVVWLVVFFFSSPIKDWLFHWFLKSCASECDVGLNN